MKNENTITEAERIAKANCTDQPIRDNAYWDYNSGDQRKQAIKVAIRHCELKAMFITLSSRVQNDLVISQLEKMLAQ